MSQFAEWLEQSSLNNALEPSAYWIIPLIQTIHILSIAVILSSMIMVNGRLIRAGFVKQTIPQTTRRFLPWMWCALGVLLLTGAVLILMEPARTLGKTIFWVKMFSVLVTAIMTAVLHHRVTHEPDRWEEPFARPVVAWSAAFNMLLWVVIVFAGRWIAYS